MSRRGRGALALASAAAFAFLSGPAWSDPRPVGLRPAIDSVEGGLWAELDKAESSARQSSELNSDQNLKQYLSSIACNLARDYCPEVRVYVMDRPYFNASMAPNGYMEVWSGLLLRAEDEAQLAFVMGHEIAHFEESHTVENYYAQKHRMTAALVVGIGVGVAGAVAAANAPVTSTQSIVDSTGHLIDAVYLTAIASYFAFSRKQEAQADSLGFESAVSNGYDPKAGSAMWRYLISEQKASDFARVRDRGAKAGIFDTHPLEETRIAALDALAAGRAPGRTERAAYRAMIRPHLDAWLRDDLRRRDFGQSLFLIDRMTASGEDLGVLNFYKGEAFRLRRKDGDLALARAAYAAAIAQPDAPAAAWREIADIDLRDGRRAEARAALVRYMEMAPQASDKALVATRIASLADVAPPPPPEPPAPADAPAPSGDAQPNPGGQTP